MNKKVSRVLVASVTAAALVGTLGACGKGSASASSGDSNEITMWTHNAGNVEELGAIQTIVDAFNKESEVKVKVQAFPQESYNDSVVAAASAGNLPCIVDIDGPNVPNWAWAQYLAPLKLTTDLSTHLPSTVAKWEGETYAVGYYDVALAMMARASDLKEAGVRVATIEQPWTEAEFEDALTKLKALGKWDYPLDMGTAGAGEWLPYAYSPFLQSFGGDLINRADYQSADGKLNSDEAVAWAEWFKGLADQGFMATKSGKDSTQDFLNNKSAVLYTGSWSADKARTALGDDLVVMPTVDLGKGPKIGGASWQWGVTTGCANSQAAMDYLSFSLKPENVAAVATATGTIPASNEAAALIPAFAEGGANRDFLTYSRDYAVMRPETPAYPIIANEFGQAVQDILAGADAKSALDKATKSIDANIKSNGGYKN